MMSFAYLGDMKRVEEEYKRGKTLVGDTWVWGDILISGARLTSGNIVSREEIPAIPMFDPI